MATSPLRNTTFGYSDDATLFTNVQPTQAELDLVSGRHGDFRRGAESALYGISAGSYAGEAMSAERAGDVAKQESALRRAAELSQRAAYEAPNQDLRKIGGVGDAIDFAQGALGNAAVTMAPSIAAALLTRGRGLAGKATAFGGSMVPAYQMERNEALLNQYQDPAQMAASVEERDLAATAKGGINAALESIVPAGLGGSLLRKPAGSLLGHIGREAATEAATEGAQQVVGFGAQKYLDPNAQLDPWDVANAAAAGAAGGGGMSAALRGPAHAAQAILDKAPKPQMPEIKNPFQRGDEAGGVVDLPDEGGGGGGAAGPADTMLGKVAGLGQAVNERFGDDIAAAGAKTKDVAGKAKDIVSDTLDRMTEAVNTATNPGEFLNKVFGGNIDEEASADVSGQPNPALKGTTFEETEANIARDDEQRVARAARYADELLNDPATPDAVKERVAAMGGDYANPDNQSFVARTLVAQRGGEKVAKAVQDLIDLGKSAFAKGSDAAKKAVGDAATAAQDRIVKKNMQSASPAEQAAFNKVVFDNLTDEAKASTFVRAHLSEVASTLMAFAAKTGDITAKDLPTLIKLSNAMSMFKDPDAMAAQLVEYGALPRDASSFLGRVKSIQNARTDIKQPNSFLYTSLTPEAKDSLTGPMLQRLAQLVDEFSLQDAAGKGDEIIEGLSQAFGSPESAQAVLDFYAQQNKADLRFDPNETLQEDGSNSVNEVDAPKASYQFKDAKAMRPFSVLRGTQRGAKESSRAAVDLKSSGSVGPNAQTRQVPYSEYVASTEGNPEAEVKRIAADIKERIAAHEKRSGEDRSQQINELKGELSAMREAYKKGGAKAALDLYEVLEVSDAKQDDGTIATDEDIAAYGKLTKGPTASKTRVTFQRTDGTKFTLSAESMWKAQGDKEGSGKGENADKRMRRLFSDAVASVLAREDVEKLVTTLDGVMLDRKTEKLVKPKRNREYHDMVQHALNEASGSLNSLKDTLAKVSDEFTELLGETGEEAESRREEIKEVLQRNIDRQQQRLDELKETGGGVPAQAIVREKMRLYREAAADISGLEFEHNVEQADENRPGMAENKPGISRLRDEMDTSKGVRYAEEDTGAAVGSTRAPKTGTGSDVESSNALDRMVADGAAVLRDGTYYVRNSGDTKFLAGTTKSGRVYVNMGMLREQGIAGYISNSPTKQAVLDALGITGEQLQTVLGSTKRMAAFLRDHELSHKAYNDRTHYPRDADGKLDLGAPAALVIEARATFDALTATERDELGMKKSPPTSSAFQRVDAQPKTSQAASSRETAKKVDDAQALSPDAITALHDVAVKENWSRLDTPAKVLKFAAMAAKAREQLKKIPELERTDVQDDLRFKLNDMFKQDGAAAFDWESLWDGLNPTDAQKAQLESIVRPKAEPGTARQSTMGAKRGQSGEVDQQAPKTPQEKVVKNSFVGAKADQQGAVDAEKLLEIGTPADVVWRTLGWFRGPDGKLRKEVRSPVLRRRVREFATAIANGDRGAVTVRDLFEGIDAFKPYLDKLGDMPIDPSDDAVERIGAVGAYMGKDGLFSGAIGLSRENAEFAVRLDAVPGVKGADLIREILATETDIVTSGDLMAVLEARYPMPDVDERVAELLADTILHELQHAFQHVEGFENGGNATTAVISKYGDVDGYLAAIRDGDDDAVERITEQAFEQLRAEVGPDGDMEAAGHELYESIVGEVEANDVAERMKLSDEEAASVKPALMDAEREFVRSVLFAEALSTFRSAMNPLRGKATSVLTKDEQQKIIDEVVRIRGKGVKVAFAKFADIGGSGEFSMNKDKTERLIKIAINSLNPMSVAWHESLHDFMAMLGGSKAERKLKADLLAASEAPQVMTKLRELLKDHPDARKQIETDREERLAYMYQFWAEGLLPLGPTGTGIFSRMVTFFREMLGVLSQDQKIDQLFTALHTGKFAEPSLVGAVLEDLKAQTLGDKARAVAGPIGDAAEAMFTGATDRLRDTNVEALAELADMFHREPGRENSGELPFLQRRAQQVGKRLNKLQDILKDTTSEERRRALENMQAMKPASTPLEKELAAYLKEMRDYMVDRGVKRFDTKTKKWTDLGNVKDYFPRVWDKEAIRNNEAEFINLMEQYIGKAQARETFNALVNGDGSLELAENEHTLGFTPWNPAVLDRQFTFINPSNAAAFAKFQSKDMADIMTSYTQRAVHRAEYAHDFGNDGEVITQKFLEAQKQGATPEEIAMARKATMAMEGTLGYEFNPRLKEVMSGIVTYQNIVLLPLSLFSNLIDPIGVAMRSNDMKEAWKAFTYGIKGIADQIRGAGDDAQTEMARTLGLIDDQNMLEAMGHVYNSMHMSRFLKNVNSKFFRYNGMEMWNQRMRVAAMMAAQRFIISHAGGGAPKISYGGNKNDSSSYKNHSKRYLEELGITESDVFQLQDGTIALTKDQLLQAGAKKSEVLDIEKRIQAAVFKWVDGAVLRPNAAHRPIWGSDPRYQLIFHLKQFTFSFQNTILRRVGEELKHGNVAPGWILLSYVPFMFLSDVMKGSLTGTLNTTADLYDVASQSIARSGITGTGVFGADAMGDLERGKLPGTSFLGPAFDHLMTLLSGITGHAGVDQVMNRSVPFAKYI